MCRLIPPLPHSSLEHVHTVDALWRWHVEHGQAMLLGLLSRDLCRVWRVSLPVFALCHFRCFHSVLSDDSVTKDTRSNEYMYQAGKTISIAIFKERKA